MNNFILAGSWRWSTALSINIDPVVYWLQRGGTRIIYENVKLGRTGMYYVWQ